MAEITMRSSVSTELDADASNATEQSIAEEDLSSPVDGLAEEAIGDGPSETELEDESELVAEDQVEEEPESALDQQLLEEDTEESAPVDELEEEPVAEDQVEEELESELDEQLLICVPVTSVCSPH